VSSAPVCRAVDDTALVLAAINGFDPHDEGSIAAPFGWDATRPAAGLRVGYFAVNDT
jgi:Asp-tRNA(Asn)/Glu-tRNA(Gln) amidotransferase A subunit family amidase